MKICPSSGGDSSPPTTGLVSEYPLGAKIWFSNPRRRKGRCSKLTSPWQGPGVVLAQISDVVLKIKMGPRALPRIVHADRLSPYKGDLMPSWISLAGVAGIGHIVPITSNLDDSLSWPAFISWSQAMKDCC